MLAELDAGHDYVGTIRMQRQDVAWRRYASRFINEIRERTTRVRITDQGCMFRGYARSVVEAVNQCSEYNTFVPALAYTFAMKPTEIQRSARGSRRRQVEVLAVPADAAEFRSDDRFLDRADAAVLGRRHRASRCCRCCSSYSWWCAA